VTRWLANSLFVDLLSVGSLSVTRYSLFVTRYSLLVTRYPLFVTRYSLSVRRIHE